MPVRRNTSITTLYRVYLLSKFSEKGVLHDISEYQFIGITLATHHFKCTSKLLCALRQQANITMGLSGDTDS